MSMKDHALAAAARGYFVFPLSPNTKIPLAGVDWRALATNDPDIVACMWDAAPAANVGVATGPSGVLVLDLDCKFGKDGLASLRVLEPELALSIELREVGRTVLTPSGGLHVYFSIDERVPNTAGTIGEGIDTRCDNGYVLAPGSVIDGAEYRLLADHPLPPAPRRFRPARETPRTSADTTYREDEFTLARARRMVAAFPILEEGNGSDGGTYALLCRLRDIGLGPDATIELLEPWADRCGFTGDWIVEKVQHVYKYGQNELGCDAPSSTFAEFIAPPVEQVGPTPEKPTNRFAAAAMNRDTFHSMPKPKWLFPGLVEEKSLNLLTGAYGTKKSFLALDFALAAATGGGWAGHESTGPVKVCYCAGEGAFGLMPRITAWETRRGEVAPTDFWLLPTSPLAVDPDDWAAFLAYIAELKPGLVVIDTVARAMVGLDEMSTKEMMLFVGRCGQVQALGAAVLLVHHEGKDASKGARGAVALPAAVELELSVALDDRGHLLVTNRKTKNAASWAAPKRFFADEIVFGEGEDGKSLALAFDPHFVPTAKKGATDEKGTQAKTVEGFALAFEVETILKTAAKASSDAKAFTASELAEAVYTNRARLGTAPDRNSPDGGKIYRALYDKFKVGEKAAVLLRPYYNADAGGWVWTGPPD